MDTSTFRQRSKDTPSYDDKRAIRERKLVKAKRGLRSLSIAVALPLILSLLASFLWPHLPTHSKTDEPASLIWHPPAWLIHVASAITSSVMGLAAWLVWAEGGMRRSNWAVVLFAAQLIMGILWGWSAAAGWVGVGVGFACARVALVAACGTSFRQVNPFAGNLVTPCAAWAAFLVMLSYRLM